MSPSATSEPGNAGPYQTAASSLHGRNHKGKFHLVAPDGSSACGGGVELEAERVMAHEVKLGLRCARDGCKDRWPAKIAAAS